MIVIATRIAHLAALMKYVQALKVHVGGQPPDSARIGLGCPRTGPTGCPGYTDKLQRSEKAPGKCMKHDV